MQVTTASCLEPRAAALPRPCDYLSTPAHVGPSFSVDPMFKVSTSMSSTSMAGPRSGAGTSDPLRIQYSLHRFQVNRPARPAAAVAALHARTHIAPRRADPRRRRNPLQTLAAHPALAMSPTTDALGEAMNRHLMLYLHIDCVFLGSTRRHEKSLSKIQKEIPPRKPYNDK